jgi:hypothetical protein
METTSRDEPAFTSSIDMVGVYTYGIDLSWCRDARRVSPRMPAYLLETCYEGEPYGRCPAASDVRRQQWWALLGCGAGEIYGVEGLWQFDDGWQQKLGSALSVAEQRLFTIAQQVSWQTLELDDALVPDRGTDTGEIAATRTSDGKQALIYVPPDGASTFTADLSQMSGAVTATWLDPTGSHSMPAGNGLTGSHAFTTPGGNGRGDGDWVLMLAVP